MWPPAALMRRMCPSYLSSAESMVDHIGASRLPEREVACRLGSSIIKTASLNKKWWTTGTL